MIVRCLDALANNRFNRNGGNAVLHCKTVRRGPVNRDVTDAALFPTPT